MLAIVLLCGLLLLANKQIISGVQSKSSHSTPVNQSLSTDELRDSTECPTWFIPVQKNDSIWCECKEKIILHGTVLQCPRNSFPTCSNDGCNVSISSGYCMTHDFVKKQTVFAPCPYSTHQPNTSNLFVTLPSDITELNDFMCGSLRREGELCNHCINNTGPSVFIEHANCFSVDPVVSHWLKFVAVVTVLPTCFYFMVLFFKLRTTTGPLNALIFFSQTLSVILFYERNPSLFLLDARLKKNWSSGVRIALEEVVGTFYGFWYDQNLWSINFAVSKVSAIQSLALEFATALYPLLLIILCCSLIWMHNRGYRLPTFMHTWLHRGIKRFNIKWKPISSIIHTFATFILLVYTKILAISFSLLAPAKIYNQSGELDYKIMPYDSSIHFMSHQHIPYVILSLSMLTVFCGLPLLILFLYPMTCFQRLLNRTPILFSEVFRTLANVYTGCYRDRTDPGKVERRYFAAFYFLIRVIYFACLYFVESSYAWLALMIVPLLVCVLFAVFQPYRQKWLNVVDSAVFALVTLITTLYAYHIYIARIPLWIPAVLLTMPFLYFLVLVFYLLVFKCRTCWWRFRHRHDEDNVALENAPLVSHSL